MTNHQIKEKTTLQTMSFSLELRGACSRPSFGMYLQTHALSLRGSVPSPETLGPCCVQGQLREWASWPWAAALSTESASYFKEGGPLITM